MSILDAILPTPRKIQGTVHIEPLAKVHVCVFEGVEPYDVLTLPGQPGRVTDVKVFGDKRRLGRKRCRFDALSCIVQVIRPPKSGCVTVRWLEHEGLKPLGAAEVSMVATTTYRSVEETWTADVDAITPGKLGDDTEATLRNLRGY